MQPLEASRALRHHISETSHLKAEKIRDKSGNVQSFNKHTEHLPVQVLGITALNAAQSLPHLGPEGIGRMGLAWCRHGQEEARQLGRAVGARVRTADTGPTAAPSPKAPPRQASCRAVHAPRRP